MAIDYAKLKSWHFDDVVQDYSWRDTVIYALGVGFGVDPTDEQGLRYLLETRLHAFPTMVTVLGLTPGWLASPATGVDYRKVLHAEQRMRLHRSLAARGSIECRSQVTEIIDKGSSKGAIVITERNLFADGGVHVATVTTSSF